MMITYIFGFLEEDSGKTTIGLHAIKYLKEIGIDVAPFKPIAGFNYWRQYENFLNSAHYGTIFSRDAYMLEEIAKSGEKLEIINPVSFLFAPADIKKYIESNVISKILFEETLVRNLVLARLTICENDKIENQVYLNKRRLEYLLHDSRIFHIIESRNSREIDITDIEKFINEINVNAKLYIESCFRKLVKTHRSILVESFNNSMLPWRGILNEEIDIVIGLRFPDHIFDERYRLVQDDSVTKAVFMNIDTGISNTEAVRQVEIVRMVEVGMAGNEDRLFPACNAPSPFLNVCFDAFADRLSTGRIKKDGVIAVLNEIRVAHHRVDQEIPRNLPLKQEDPVPDRKGRSLHRAVSPQQPRFSPSVSIPEAPHLPLRASWPGPA